MFGAATTRGVGRNGTKGSARDDIRSDGYFHRSEQYSSGRAEVSRPCSPCCRSVRGPLGAGQVGCAAALDLRGLAMDTDIERYIHEQNLILYRKVLSETTDQTKRQTLLRLLEDEQANPTRRSRQGS
jgi:hypothetical protein